jgi:hypothetical protein
MASWNDVTEFLATGMVVLPTTLGIGMDSLEVFAVTMGAMLILLICVGLGGTPSIYLPDDKDKRD